MWVSPARPGTDEIVTEVPVEPREPPTSPETAQVAAEAPDTPTVLPVVETVQIAAEKPRRPRRPPLPPAKRELRQARGLLAGGIILATLCSAGFGFITYALIAGRDRFNDRSRSGAYTMLGATFSCTLASAAGIGVGARKLRSLKGRVAWTGGLGLQF